jgi:hypothetical protein
MERSEIRGCFRCPHDKPGLRCAPSGRRLLVDGWSLVAGSLVQSYGGG